MTRNNRYMKMTDSELTEIVNTTEDLALENALREILDRRIAARTAAALRDHRAAYARSLARRMKGC